MTQKTEKMYTIHQKLTMGKKNLRHILWQFPPLSYRPPKKKSAFRKAEKYIIFLANMALILQSGS
jgi:hypothetical protein